MTVSRGGAGEAFLIYSRSAKPGETFLEKKLLARWPAIR